MYKTLRIIFTVVSAVFAGLALPVGYLLEGEYAFVCAVGCAIVAFIAFGLMMLCKKNQEIDERKNGTPSDISYPNDSFDDSANQFPDDKKTK